MLKGRSLAQVRAGSIQTHPIHVLRLRQQFEELHDMYAPACDVARQLFQHGSSAFTPPVADGIGNFDTRAARQNVVWSGITDEVTDVGYDPFLAGLDKLIVVELRQVLFQHLYRIRNYG